MACIPCTGSEPVCKEAMAFILTSASGKMGTFGNPFHARLHRKVLISTGELPDPFDSIFERLIKEIALCTSVALPLEGQAPTVLPAFCSTPLP